jgi:hypothetical protein
MGPVPAKAMTSIKHHMKFENKQRTGDMLLTSPNGIPYPFTILISSAWPTNNADCSFEIKGTGALDSSARLNTYKLHNREHTTYLDFFEQLSKDFGLRLPQNRKAGERKTFTANFREVLTDNIDPGIIYGYGDPAIISVQEYRNHKGDYFLIATSNDAPDSFPILRSKDLIDWQFVGYVFPAGNKPLWASDGEGQSDYWAPEMHKVKDEYRIYFVAREKFDLGLCIGVAKAAKPDGPFVADDTPLLTGNVIDPHLFVEDEDTAFLYWKEDNNDVWPRLLLDFLYDQPEMIALLFAEKEDLVSVSFIVSLWPWARMLEPMERFQAVQLFIEIITSDYIRYYDLLEVMAETKPFIKETVFSIRHHMKTPVFAQQLSEDGSGFIGE